jgi:hypothetical protein
MSRASQLRPGTETQTAPPLLSSSIVVVELAVVVPTLPFPVEIGQALDVCHASVAAGCLKR